MKRVACLGFSLLCAFLCVFGAFEAYAQDSVAVMKIDVVGSGVDAQAGMLFEALRREVGGSQFELDESGSDITYSEMQMLTGCDQEDDMSCYSAACGTLGSSMIVFGTMKDGGTTRVVWYNCVHREGQYRGIIREVPNAVVTDQASAAKLASDLIVGKMGTLIVTSNVPGADVFIGGRRVGMAAEFASNAQPISLLSGRHMVIVRKDGYNQDPGIELTIEGDKQQTVHVDLTVAIDENKIKGVMKITGWTTLGVGLGSLAAAGLVSYMQYDLNNAAKAAILGDKDEVSSKFFTFEGADRHKKANDKGKDVLQITNIVLWGAGGLLTVAGVTMVCLGYFYDFGSDEAMAGMPKIDIAVTPEYQGVSFGWRF
ncbi:MAG: PEGA domain-containing protein [Proteobacteria bacterium]|nr:PEGA domain-containing protein [Pseudomonadota bacterium]